MKGGYDTCFFCYLTLSYSDKAVLDTYNENDTLFFFSCPIIAYALQEEMRTEEMWDPKKRNISDVKDTDIHAYSTSRHCGSKQIC